MLEGDRDGVVFSGDLSDPWVRALAEAIPVRAVSLDGTVLPEGFPVEDSPGGILVLHRANLTAGEAARLRRLREGEGAGPRVVLVLGPHVRYHQVMAWSDLADVVLPEATASETIARHLGRKARRVDAADGRRPDVSVAVSSGNFGLRRMLEDALSHAGYRPRGSRDEPEDGPEPWLVWDVPRLDPDWPARLKSASGRRRGVVALLGLADREAVAIAREHGASACLDLPGEPEDLIFVLDRLTAREANRGAKPRADLPRPHRPRSLGVRGKRRPPILPR